MAPFELSLKGQGGTGASGDSIAGPNISFSGPVSVAPVGANLGSIFNALAGDPANGGAGFNVDFSGLVGWSPFGGAPTRTGAAVAAPSVNWLMLAAIAALGAGAWYVLK